MVTAEGRLERHVYEIVHENVIYSVQSYDRWDESGRLAFYVVQP